MRLIDADKLILDMAYWHGDKCSVDCIEPDGVQAVDVSDINSAPTIDPVKHGHWIIREDTQYHYECCHCKCLHQYKGNYCSLCGAKMDEPTVTK